MRFILEADGDFIARCIPDVGYTHRGIEKIAENRTYIQAIPLVERCCIQDASNVVFGYVNTVEELMGITPPERAQYIRVIMAEINRIASHLIWCSFYSIALGFPAYTAALWAIGDRELFLDLAEMVTGKRITYTFFTPGGVLADLPEGFAERATKTLNYFENRLNDYDEMVLKNKVFQARTKQVGVLKPGDAVKLGVTGPTLRGSGVKVDLRKEEPYAIYDQLDFDIAVEKEGDCYARAKVRFKEMKESISIIRQALDKIPKGPIRVRVPLRVPAGEAYGRVEAARGEMGYYIISDGTNKPYRLKISTPSFRNVSALSYMLKGAHVADMPAIIYSVDPWPLDVDR